MLYYNMFTDIEDNELEDNTSNNYIITLKKSENENEDENEISKKHNYCKFFKILMI